MNKIDRVMNARGVKDIIKVFPALSYYLRFELGESENFRDMNDMADIVIDLINYVNSKSNIFRYRSYVDFMRFFVENIVNILRCDNFKNGVISVENVYCIVNRFIDIFNDCNLRAHIPYDGSAKIFFEIICDSNLNFSKEELKLLCDSLGYRENMYRIIGKIFVNNVKRNNPETNTAISSYIDIDIYNEHNKIYLGLFSTYFILCKHYLEGQIELERVDSIISLMEKFYDEHKEYRLNGCIEKYYSFCAILKSSNFKKGIIPDSYLEEYFKCSYVEQLRTMANLLTCEYFEEGFITEEHIKFVSNDKDYVFIPFILDYILTYEIPVEGNRYDFVLGILNFAGKKELCDELYSFFDRNLAGKDKYWGIKKIAFNYLQYNLFFPKFDVKPFAKKRVPESGN